MKKTTESFKLVFFSLMVGIFIFINFALVGAFSNSASFSEFSIYWSMIFLFGSLLNGLFALVSATSENNPLQAPSNRLFTLLSLLVSVASGLFTFAVDSQNQSSLSQEFLVALLVALATFSVTTTNFFFALLNRSKRFFSYGLFALTDAGMRLAITSVVAAFTSDTVIRLLSFFAAGLASMMIGYFVFKPELLANRKTRVSSTSFQTDKVLILLGSGALLPLMVGVPFMVAFGKSDEELGQLASLLSVVSILRAPILMPTVFMRNYFAKTMGDTQSHLQSFLIRISLYFTIASLAIAACLAFIANPLFDVVFAAAKVAIRSEVIFLVVIGAGVQAIANLALDSLMISQKYRIYAWLGISNLTAVFLLLFASKNDLQIALVLLVPTALIAGAAIFVQRSPEKSRA